MPKVNHDLQKDILSKTSFFKSGARYSELKLPNIENDLFNYHLQHLVKEGLLEKVDGFYTLTESGKILVTNIDEIDKKLPANYKVSVYMCLVVSKRVLLSKRQKHPQYGYVGFPSGKIRFGEHLLDTAKREFLEETGLQTEFQLIGNLRQIRKNRAGQVIEDGIFYVCYSNHYSGQLNQHCLESENIWVDIDEVSRIDKLFKPSVEIISREISERLADPKHFESRFIYELAPEPEDY